MSHQKLCWVAKGENDFADPVASLSVPGFLESCQTSPAPRHHLPLGVSHSRTSRLHNPCQNDGHDSWILIINVHELYLWTFVKSWPSSNHIWFSAPSKQEVLIFNFFMKSTFIEFQELRSQERSWTHFMNFFKNVMNLHEKFQVPLWKCSWTFITNFMNIYKQFYKPKFH